MGTGSELLRSAIHSWHEYQAEASPRELGFVFDFSNYEKPFSKTDLDNADQELVTWFEEACEGAEFDIYLANLDRIAISRREEVGEYHGYWRGGGSYCSWDDEEEGEEEEWYSPEVTYKLSGLRSLDGRVPFQNIQLEFCDSGLQLLGDEYGIFGEDPDDIEEDTTEKEERFYKSVSN